MKNVKVNAPTTTLDIIFEHRNKAYGAYALRMEEGTTMMRAFFIFFVLLVMLVTLSAFKTEVKKTEKIEVVVSTTTIILPDISPKVQEVPQKIEAPKPQAVKAKSIKFLPPVVVKNESVVPNKPLADMEELKKTTAVIGSTTNKVGADKPNIEDLAAVDLGDFRAIETPKTLKEPETKVWEFVEKSASFPGGEALLLSFLQKEIIYPAIAKENNIQGRVVLTFVVEPDGSISGIKALRTVAGGCTEEAVRVVQSMPKWMPANQNGTVVRQKMTIPITFSLR